MDAFLREHPQAVLLKLGPVPQERRRAARGGGALADRADLELGLIRVLEARPASHHVATLTGIVHESPQLVLFRGGRAVFDRDNWDITPEAIAEGLAALDGVAEPAAELAERG